MAIQLIDSYSESNQIVDGTINSTAPEDAQSFTAIAGRLAICKFYLKKNGSPTGNYNAKLYAHSGTYGTSSVPTGSALATSVNLNIADLTTSYQLITLNFTGVNQYTLVNGTKYCIAIRYSGGDGSNYLKTGVDNTSPTHGGNRATYNGTSWSAVDTQDVCFYVYKYKPTGEFLLFM